MAYYKFSTYLKERFKTKVHKVSVDAGFSCPNTDGKISTEGCIYCDNRAFTPPFLYRVDREAERAEFSFQKRSERPLAIEKQIGNGIEAARKRFGAEKFIVYFQAHTNTYAPIDVLKKRYDTIREFNDIVGLAIATRPDCINDETLKLIDTYAGDYEVWIEYGLQSAHNRTLEFINRGHTYEDFLKAVELTHRYRIKICAHVIIGLPTGQASHAYRQASHAYRQASHAYRQASHAYRQAGLPNETEEMILETARKIAELKIDGIKIHPLHVVKGTKLEELFLQGKYTPLKIDDYLRLLRKFLNCLPTKMVIHRLSAYCPKELLAAPKWVSERNIVEKQIA